jgi:hypothetical protein
MQVEMRPIDTIRPYENNPRQNDAGVDAFTASISAFGFRPPIVVDEESVIVVGHTRYKAALKLGLEEVPVHLAVGLIPAQAKASRRDCLKIGMNISAARTSHRLTGQLVWRERSQPDYPGSRLSPGQ